ncbi:hypothetical protein HNO86_23980 [Pseudomonas sp. C1C7]|uniref:hypothetical protein n=1 Tax=Pseudomonas sp. C1C7 TaxID=2735272 RepID=UPI0015864DAE|nr:hypothetical protein [Pseudomonas sp. C1C7]NUT78105.1 hypothetical protein [Pseudomonas sp. C1C7]
MTVVRGTDLREKLADEDIAPPQILNGDGFTLQPRAVKVFKPTGAPVYLYDVLTDGPERVGIASLVLEPDSAQVADVGHACANLAEDQTDPGLLARIAEKLIAHGYEQGLPSVRVVVPSEDAKSIKACEAQPGTCRRQDNDYSGKQFACFDYPAADQ